MCYRLCAAQEKSKGQRAMNIAKYIDHTLLKPEATPEQIRKLCDEALQYGFASVCVNSEFTFTCIDQLGSMIPVCSVVGFPLGAMETKAKWYEAGEAIKHGAKEIDMVMQIGLLKAGLFSDARKDIASVVDIAHKYGAIVKVIIETALLTHEEKIKSCELVVKAGADFVKTSTGFSSGGATVEDVKLMRKVVGPDFGVKASGGIKDYHAAMAMIEAGANRLGCSAGVAIAEEAAKQCSSGAETPPYSKLFR